MIVWLLSWFFLPIFFIDGQLNPLLRGITEETAVLPPSQGSQYQVVAAAVDNVGNIQPLEDAVNSFLLFNVSTTEITCLNDCSGRGQCSTIGICQCQSGFYGSDCSQGKIFAINLYNSYTDTLQ